MPTEWSDKPFDKPLVYDDVVSKPVTTNPGLHPDFKRVLEELNNMEWHGHQRQMYVDLLPDFAEERLLHVSGAEQIAREWYKRRDGGGWDSLTTTAQELHIKVFARLINDGVIVAGPQLFRQVD